MGAIPPSSSVTLTPYTSVEEAQMAASRASFPRSSLLLLRSDANQNPMNRPLPSIIDPPPLENEPEALEPVTASAPMIVQRPVMSAPPISTVLGSTIGKYVGTAEAIEPELLVSDKDLGNDLTCGICYRLLQQPSQCQLGHLFCTECIKASLQIRAECPVCRTPLTTDTLSRALFAEKRMPSLPLYCRYRLVAESGYLHRLPSPSASASSASPPSSPTSPSSSAPSSSSSSSSPTSSPSSTSSSSSGSVEPRQSMLSSDMIAAMASLTPHRVTQQTRWFEDERGCPEVITVENFQAHVSKCPFVYQTCPFNPTGCPFLRRSELKAHLAECEYQPLLCSFCSEELPRCAFQRHQETECTGYPSACSDCSAQVPRSDMAEHRRLHCPNTMLECPYRRYEEGCAGFYARNELGAHLKEACDHHLDLVELQHRREISTLQAKVSMLEQTLVALTTHTIKWTIPDFAVRSGNQFIQSSKFRVADLTWFLGLWPSGDEPNQANEYMSGYLYISPLPVRGRRLRFEFMIRARHPTDQSVAMERHFCSEFPLPDGSRSTGWGERNLFKKDLLHTAGFLANDSLALELDLLIVSDAFELTVD